MKIEASLAASTLRTEALTVNNVPKNRVSWPVVLSINHCTQKAPLCPSPQPVLTETPLFYLYCLSPSTICPLHWAPPLPPTRQPANPTQQTARRTLLKHKSDGASPPIRIFEWLPIVPKTKFSTCLLKRLIFWVLPSFPAQPQASLPWLHARSTVLTCIQLLDHGRAQLSRTPGFAYTVLYARKPLPTISMLGWHLPINQVPAESPFSRAVFFKHSLLSQTDFYWLQ